MFNEVIFLRYENSLVTIRMRTHAPDAARMRCGRGHAPMWLPRATRVCWWCYRFSGGLVWPLAAAWGRRGLGRNTSGAWGITLNFLTHYDKWPIHVNLYGEGKQILCKMKYYIICPELYDSNWKSPLDSCKDTKTISLIIIGVTPPIYLSQEIDKQHYFNSKCTF